MDAPTLLRRSSRRLAFVALTLAVAPLGALAQLVPIRTVPVSQDHQFRLFPSNSAAMGGVSIALADSLLDPFANPAWASAIAEPFFFSTPATYGVSNEAGGGRTLPSGAFGRRGPWHGGILLALQEVDLSERTAAGPGFFTSCPACASQGLPLGSNARSPGNEYVFAMASREIPSAGLSMGGSVFWAGLDGVDGVDLLYAGSAGIRQRGSALDIRVGLTKELEGEASLEALVLHNRFGMTHDVYYLDAFWDPGTRSMAQRPRLEQNLDRTNTWGLHVEYRRPLPSEGWRVGWLGTVNYKTHPKIPNYEIMNIPRDPGRSWAFDLGLGVARTLDTTTFGLDVVYEPIWSYTWADAAAPVTTDAGRVIPEGGRTIENWFRFGNAVFRLGVGDELDVGGRGGTWLGLKWGLEARRISYRLEQRDNVRLTERDLEEAWIEWAPTWGVGLRRPGWELRYQGSVTHGTGRPGVGGPGGCFDVCLAGPGELLSASSNVLVAPSGPLTLDEVSVLAHQITFLLPFR